VIRPWKNYFGQKWNHVTKLMVLGHSPPLGHSGTFYFLKSIFLVAIGDLRWMTYCERDPQANNETHAAWPIKPWNFAGRWGPWWDGSLIKGCLEPKSTESSSSPKLSQKCHTLGDQINGCGGGVPDIFCHRRTTRQLNLSFLQQQRQILKVYKTRLLEALRTANVRRPENCKRTGRGQKRNKNVKLWEEKMAVGRK